MTGAGSPDTVRPAPAPVADPPLCLPGTDWLHHRLQVSGPAEAVALFTTAAQGAGIIPWVLDLIRIEEDLFLLLAAPVPPRRRSLSLSGARTLARQLAEASAERQAAANARVAYSRACPLDLHALLPVPPVILALGPDHPEALAWLWAHWGTAQALRHVAREPAPALRKPKVSGTGIVGFTFWSADWTPWRAFGELARRWPGLRFDIRPTYETA